MIERSAVDAAPAECFEARRALRHFNKSMFALSAGFADPLRLRPLITFVSYIDLVFWFLGVARELTFISSNFAAAAGEGVAR
jgi:hypothetical protein